MNNNLHSPRYKILIDHITELEVLDRDLNKRVFKKPHDILFSNEYKEYSSEDIIRIGFICGQTNKMD
jgi:hypothetical protein